MVLTGADEGRPGGASVAPARARLVAVALVGLVFVAVHLALVLHDLSSPGSYLAGDRSHSRELKIEALAHDGLPYLYGAGPPGDYVVHAALEMAGGRMLVILVQIALALACVVGAMVIAGRMTDWAWPVCAAGLLATVAPGMLMNPHMLVTEAWSTAGFTLGCVGLASPERERRTALLLAFLGFGLAAFFRPITLVVPAVAGLALIVFRRERPRAVLPFVLLAYGIFPGAWLVIRYLATGQFGLGASDFDLNLNFWMRAARVAAPGDAFDPYATLGKMPLGPFLQTLAAHPVGTLKSFAADAANLFGNPGVTHLFGHYLHAVSVPDDVTYLHNLLDREGPVGLGRAVLGFGPGFLLASAAFAVLQLAVVASYGVTAVLLIRHGWPGPRQQLAAILLVVVVASLIGVFAAGSVRWAQRSNVEPVSAALLAVTLAMVRDGRRRPAGPRAEPQRPGRALTS